jgi:hypothetical protein
MGVLSKVVSGTSPVVVWAGIERLAGRIAVGVDHVAVEGRPDRGRALDQAVVEPVDMPVGIAQQSAFGIEIVENIVRNMGAGVRQTEDEGAIATLDENGDPSKDLRQQIVDRCGERAGMHEISRSREIWRHVAIVDDRGKHPRGNGRWRRREGPM